VEYDAVWDDDLTLRALEKDKPTFLSLSHADAIYQAIYDGVWPQLREKK